MRKMKDSGIDIVGDIPVEWNLIRLRYLAQITTGDSDTQDADPDGIYPFYVRSPIVERSTSFTFNGEGILMAGDGAGAGRVFHHAFGKYAVHQRVYRLFDFKINSYFLFYFISNLFPSVMDKGSAQSTVPSVRLPMLQNFEVCQPPLSEQKRIADFLDAKCADIDQIRADIEKQIEILTDYKKSVITEAVTKGLDPKAKMKDSGIEWIGKIPEHWGVDKLKFHLKFRGTKNPGDTIVLSLYRELGVVPKDSRDDNHNKTSEDTSNYRFVRIGDFVINKMKAWQGSVAVSDYEGIVSPAYYVYGFSDDLIFKRYFHYLLRDKSYATEFKRLSGGIRVGQWDLPRESLENTLILLPPISEQKNIAAYLDEKCSEIDATIAEKQKQLETLEEYKKSLIFEYVTGKKEVV